MMVNVIWLLFLVSHLCCSTKVQAISGKPETDLADSSGKIFGGTQATFAEFPFVVSITVDNAHVCGGFIYNEKFAITAASCVDGGIPVNRLKVVAGQLSLISPDPEEQNVPVSNVIIFDGFNELTKLHDIAIIEVARPFVLNENVTFIKFEEINDFGSSEAVTMGWGAVQVGGLPYTRLRRTDVTIFDTDCKSYGSDEYYSNYMLCVGKEGDAGTPCPYDEGSPLVQDNIAIGIMSKIKVCGTPPAIYTRLGPYYPWLFKYAGQQPAFGAWRSSPSN